MKASPDHIEEESGRVGREQAGPDHRDWARRSSSSETVRQEASATIVALNESGGSWAEPIHKTKSAVIYLFNPVSIPKATPAVVRTRTSPDPRMKVIGGVAIRLGIVPVDSMSEAEFAMHGGAPRGKGYYHVNVSLFDDDTRAQIDDASVELTIKDPVMGDKTKELERMAINYGNYFQMTGWDSYAISVRIRRPDMIRRISANFDLRP